MKNIYAVLFLFCLVSTVACNDPGVRYTAGRFCTSEQNKQIADFVIECIKTSAPSNIDEDRDDLVEACTDSAKETFCPTEPAFYHCPRMEGTSCTATVPCRDAAAPDEIEACKTHRNIYYHEFNSK